jgi:hypothetical protein
MYSWTKYLPILQAVGFYCYNHISMSVRLFNMPFKLGLNGLTIHKLIITIFWSESKPDLNCYINAIDRSEIGTIIHHSSVLFNLRIFNPPTTVKFCNLTYCFAFAVTGSLTPTSAVHWTKFHLTSWQLMSKQICWTEKYVRQKQTLMTHNHRVITSFLFCFIFKAKI